MSSAVEQGSTNSGAVKAKGRLLNGDFDVENLLSELTTEEKASLLSGMYPLSRSYIDTRIANN